MVSAFWTIVPTSRNDAPRVFQGMLADRAGGRVAASVGGTAAPGWWRFSRAGPPARTRGVKTCHANQATRQGQDATGQEDGKQAKGSGMTATVLPAPTGPLPPFEFRPIFG